MEFQYEKDRIIRVTRNSGYTECTYDDKGNITKQAKYFSSSTGISELSNATEYEYDNMHNPYQSFKRLATPGVYSNLNNITREIYTIYFEVDQWSQKVQVTNNTYEYNDKGYPIKVNGLTEYVYK